jgi:hypothetical protein
MYANIQPLPMQCESFKIPSKNMHEEPTNTPIIHSVLLIMYGSSHMFWHYIAILRERS